MTDVTPEFIISELEDAFSVLRAEVSKMRVEPSTDMLKGIIKLKTTIQLQKDLNEDTKQRLRRERRMRQ